jgi:hypothetical protein
MIGFGAASTFFPPGVEFWPGHIECYREIHAASIPRLATYPYKIRMLKILKQTKVSSFSLDSVVCCGMVPMPGSLDKKSLRKCNFLPNKRWHLLPPFLFNEPGTICAKM